MSNRPPSRPHSGKAWSEESSKETSTRSQTPIQTISKSSSDKQLIATKDVPKSCGPLRKVGDQIRSLWATRLTEDTKNDPIKYVKTILRELTVYLVFLGILCIISFGMVSPTMYYYTKVMTELFLESDFDDSGTQFRGMANMKDFWNFAQSTFLDGVYWEKWYNGANISSDEMGFLIHENKLLGVPRIRMLKVKNDSCIIPSDFRSVIKDCYSSYSDGEQDTKPFGPYSTSTLKAWEYRSSSQLGGSGGQLGQLHYYPGGGYTQDLAATRPRTEAILEEMKENLWLGRGSRAIFIDLTVYNANINLFCFVRLIVELPASGGTITSWDFRTVKLLRYVTPFDYFILFLECVFVLYILYYIVEESIELKKHKLAYLKSFWNILDILVILLALASIAFNIYRSIEVSTTLEQLLKDPDMYADFEFLTFWQVIFNYCVAVMTFFAWAKLFKYLSFNKTMNQLSTTLSRSAKDLGGFAVMFFIIFFAFAQMGYLLFGSLIRDFSSFLAAVYTLFRIILGDFNFNELEQADRILGPTYFITYVFFVFFILLNMFLAIINDTYTEVKADMAARGHEYGVSDYLKARAQVLMKKIKGRKENINKINKALETANTNNDSLIDFDEWRADLKGKGFEDKEIDSMFKRYDVDGDNALDEAEQQKMKKDLEQENQKLDSDYKRAQSRLEELDDYEDDDLLPDEDQIGKKKLHRDDFEELEMRVDNMELSIGNIVDKIDVVLVKLEAMEKAKAKRREAMANILNIISEGDETTDSEKKENMEKLVRAELRNWEKESPTL